MKRKFIATIIIFFPLLSLAQKQFTVSGYIYEKGSKEPLTGVNVAVPAISVSLQANKYGFYSVQLPSGKNQLIFAFSGFEKYILDIDLQKDTEIAIEMVVQTTKLEGVNVKAKRDPKVSEDAQMSQVSIPVQTIKDLPALLGEKDVLKVLQLMPGVQKGSEGSSGIYVRGGGPDQNLIILDDAPVYNANHLFGFFSLFNGDALKSVELTKGGFPARYGGRLSSVIEMQMKEGNKTKFHGEGGIGSISSRFTLEGPLIKNKASFLISARRTYLDLILRPLIRNSSPGADGGYDFYDLNAKVNYNLDKKNRLYLSSYFGRDVFFSSYKEDDFKLSAGINWGNATGTLRWNHIYNSKFFSNTSLIYSNYKFNVYTTMNFTPDYFKLDYLSGIRDVTLKHDFDYYRSNKHQLKFGLMAIMHHFTPSAVTVKTSFDSALNVTNKKYTNALESGLYIEDYWKPNAKWKVNSGLRLSAFTLKTKTYMNLEPRISAAYTFKNNQAFKASYAMMNQYIHLLSNTGIGLPTDLWIPTTSFLKPQQSQQVAVGYARDIPKYDLALTVEGYYKTMHNIIGYKEGASLMGIGDIFDNPSGAGKDKWQKVVTQGRGWSYGTEFLLQKKVGKFAGWIGYTLSWTQLQFADLNFGKKFNARYDRRHDASIVGIYKPNDKWTFSFVWVYGTGNAITLQNAQYDVIVHNPNSGNNMNVPNLFNGESYGEKNSSRMGAYHRMDIGIKHYKKMKKYDSYWDFSVYNVYNHYNPFFYFISTDKKGYVNLKQITLFPILPTITYGFKF